MNGDHRRQLIQRVQVEFPNPTKTRQSFKDECDINTILGKFRETGFVSHTNPQRPIYEDFTNASDYMTALNQITAAQEIFQSMPARVRDRVGNDPANFIAFVENPENAEELVTLGLKNPVEPRPPKPPEPEAAAEPIPETGGENPPNS